MNLLPIVYSSDQHAAVIDSRTGELVLLKDASDASLAEASDRLKQIADEARDARRLVEDELRLRLAGLPSRQAGAFAVERKTKREWDEDKVAAALAELLEKKLVTKEEINAAVPERVVRRCDGRKLNALLTRLVGVDPVAAQPLAQARVESSWMKVTRTAIDAEATAA